MALPVRKGYKGAPAQAVLTNSPTSGDTSFVVDTVTGWATTFPFYCVVEPGTSKEEKVKVTAISTLTLTVVRAQDDTSASGHNAGAAIYPVFTADEADEANEIASVMTTKGDLIATNGSSINRLGIGTNTHVLQADSTATNGFKWGQVAEAGIADSAVTSAKILDGTIVNADINASAAIALSKLATGALPTAITVASANLVDLTIATADIVDGAVTSDKILDGTIVNADVNASAAIALSKLATGALPTAITIASANIVDGTIVAGDLATGSVTAAKLSGMYGITYTDLNITSMTTSYADYKVTIPSSKSYFDIVSVNPLVGTNDIVYIESYALGDWGGGNLSPNEIIIRAKLGNAVASSTGTVRFWFTA